MKKVIKIGREIIDGEPCAEFCVCREDENGNDFVKKSLDLPLQLCPVSREVCPFFYGACFAEGERQEIGKVDCPLKGPTK